MQYSRADPAIAKGPHRLVRCMGMWCPVEVESRVVTVWTESGLEFRRLKKDEGVAPYFAVDAEGAESEHHCSLECSYLEG